MRRVLALLVACLLVLAGAVTPPHRDLTPQQETRAQRVGDNLRCPVCRGLPITESPNDLSAQMMREVRDQVAAGRSDDQIYDYFAARFGDTVLLDPPRRGVTLLLWLVPLAALALGALL
ncbi:cytochrome c-type biogenesis protein, partial [Deinococcus pimensis]|uniref:cytochrome c-type biogenesis protein n=1 Tax=Deinococcus pimensis TaxID=309888 RepID=UPI000A01BDF0